MPNNFSHHDRGYDARRDVNGVPERYEVAPHLQRSIAAFERLSAQWRRGMTINAHERLALVHLWESGSMTMSELGERIPLSRAAVTALTDRLERMGYLRRTPDEQDRRRTLLSLTSRPYEVLTPMASPFSADLVEVSRAMSDDEWRTVVKFLDNVHRVSHEHARRIRAMGDDELHDLVDAGVKAAQAARA
ncbi:MAG: MarR family transcriptional regulator [Thermoleophilia bacterium]|nr:MarR family transcriptional regulator [Thermoleophilia bacterium]